MTRQRYPASVREGFKSLAAAKGVIKSLFEENKTLKESLANTQDELENWRSKYHASDKEASILDAQIRSSVLAEIIKFLVSTILAGIGINIATDGQYLAGSALAALAIISYIGIVALSRRR